MLKLERNSLQRSIEMRRDSVRKTGGFSFRDPSLAWRMVFAGALYAMPGFLAGALLSVLVGDYVVLLLVVGAIVGAVAGVLTERWE